MSAVPDGVEPRDSPYFGLDYYQEKFGAWFFGREAEGSKIISNLRAARLTLLHAESGVGKSSLLRAGVAWRMQKLADDSLARRGTARSVPIVFSSWKDDPVAELTGAIRSSIGPYLAGSPAPVLPGDRLSAAIETASGAVNSSLLIMLDQFEEYFLYCAREPTPERFAEELARCINQPDLRANFLIAIREDAYAGLGDLFKGRIANVYGNYLHVDYLDRASAEQAIRAPLDIYNCQPRVEPVRVQDELVDAVLDQVRAFDVSTDGAPGRAAANGGGDRVATPLLQLVMETIWERERAQGSHELRLATLQDLRGVKMIVDAHLGKALGALGGGERQTAIDMFDHLVTPSGGKIAESVPDLAQRTGHTEAQVAAVLEKLDRERIVRPVPAAPGQDPMRYRRYEIFHDVLAPTINRAIAAREERRRARRLRLLASSVAGLLLVTMAIVGVFAYLWTSAKTNQKIAESRQLAAEADVNVSRDPELSALLALQAINHVYNTSDADEALRKALPELQAIRTFPDGSSVLWAAFDPVDSNKVASADSSGRTVIWDVKTGRPLVTIAFKAGFQANGSADAVAFSPTGSQVAVGYADGQVTRFNARTGELVQQISVPAGPGGNYNSVNDVAYVGSAGELAIATQQGTYLSPLQTRQKCCRLLSKGNAITVAVDPRDPEEIAVAASSGTDIWNLDDAGVPREQQLQQGARWSANDAEFSHNGSQVVTAGSDGKVRLYDLGSLQTVTSLDAGETDAFSAAFSPDGSQIVAGYASGRTRVWDTSTGLQMTVLAGHAAQVYTTAFSADSREVATASADGTIRVWYSRPRELRADFPPSPAGGAPTTAIGARYLSGRRILVVNTPGDLYVSTPGGAPVALIHPPNGGVASWASDDGGTRIVTMNSAGTVTMFQARGTTYAEVPMATPFPSDVNQFGISRDGSTVAIMANNDQYTIQLLSSRTGKLQRTLIAADSITALSYGASLRQIYAGDYHGQLEVFSTAGGEPQVLGKPGSQISDVEVSQHGNEVVTMSVNGTISIWALHGDGSPEFVRNFDACPSPSEASPNQDGSMIVVTCGDGSAQVFDATTGDPLTVLPTASAGPVASAAFSPDGSSIVTVVTGAGSGGVQVWSVGLAKRSLSAVVGIANKRVTRQLTPAERGEYLAGNTG